MDEQQRAAIATTFDRLNTALAGRYRLDRLVGSGGMAGVFLAHDARHNRQVALKVLHSELAATIGAERFLAEIRVTAKLQHPHILPLHESGQSEGILYYVMPFVAGESLRVKMDREGQLPVADVVRLATAIASALDYAHRQGIVHRDIKPENVLLSDGVPVVADFGIARAVTAAGAERITQTGLSVGTPAYMSPEQAAGDPNVDSRSDIYALGVLCYEMLAGDVPFTGMSPQQIMVKRFTTEAPSLTLKRPDVPASLDAAVLRALSREPADRFETAAEFGSAIAASLNEAPAPRLSTPVTPRGSVALPADVGGTTLAVMPFENLSADRSSDYFCDGMTDEIAGALSRLRGVRVASRTSTTALKGRKADLEEVGRLLKVTLVLEGTVRQAGEQLRVSTQLVDVATGFHLWSEKFDRKMADVFEVQDELAAAISEALRSRLTAGAGAPTAEVRRGTQNLEAYHLVLKGRHFWNTRALDKALESFQQALALDPNYAEAYCGLADGMTYLSYYGVIPPQAALSKGRGAVQRATICGPLLAETHYSLGLFEFITGWDMDVAGQAIAKAIEINPRMGQARATRAQWLASFARVDEARREGDAALVLEPLSPLVHATVAYATAFAGEASRGIAIAKAGLDLDPNAVACLWVLGELLGEMGQHEEALVPLKKAAELSPRAQFIRALLGHTLAKAGRTDAARAMVAEIEGTDALKPFAPGLTAWILEGLGDTDEAVRRFVIAAEAHDPRVIHPAVMPVRGAAVRRHPAYAAFLDNYGLTKLREARTTLDR